MTVIPFTPSPPPAYTPPNGGAVSDRVNVREYTRRPPQIKPGPHCGWPDRCKDKGIDHAPEPGARRIWGYHDVQCQVPNPRPGPHLDGYPECGLIDGHSGDHDYVRHAAERS